MNYSRYADYAALIIIVAVFILFENITLNSPIVFGDEGYYGSAARWMAKNLVIPQFFPLTESAIYHERFSTSKPIFFFYEVFGYFFGGEGFVKFLIAVPSAVGAALLYLIVKKRYGWEAAIFSTFLFLMTPSLITYGVLGYVDTLLLVFILASIHFSVSAFENKNKVHLLMAGIFTGLAVLTKNSGVALFLFYFLYGIFVDKLKNKKYLATFFIIAILLSSAWLARNFIVYGSPCYWKLWSDESCGPKIDVAVPKVSELQFEGRTLDVGTESGLFKLGFLNYTRFAYGWALPFLFFLGLALALVRKGPFDKLLLILLFSILPLFIFSTWRAEDTARYMLPLIIPAVIFSGIFVGKISSTLSKKHFALGIIVIFLAMIFSWPYGAEKISVMSQVKQFVPAAIDGCKWIRENTPQNSAIFATYASQIRYQCERNLALARDAEEVMLGNETISHEHLALNGIKYVFVINGLITERKFQENYPASFVNMMDNSTFFKKVYDNSDKFGANSVRIFEVL